MPVEIWALKGHFGAATTPLHFWFESFHQKIETPLGGRHLGKI